MISTDNQFHTLGDLAKHYKKNEQAIRRAFKRMVKSNLLKLDEDYIKSNYKDEKHFVYLVDQKCFDRHYRETMVSPPLLLNEPQGGNQADIKSTDTDIDFDDSDGQLDIGESSPAMSNENQTDIKDKYLVTLEEQLKTKDNQIEEKDNQIRELQESSKVRDQLVVALNNQLLRLTDGKNDESGARKNEVTYEPIEREEI